MARHKGSRQTSQVGVCRMSVVMRFSESARQCAHHLPKLASAKLADRHEGLVNGDLP